MNKKDVSGEANLKVVLSFMKFLFARHSIFLATTEDLPSWFCVLVTVLKLFTFPGTGTPGLNWDRSGTALRLSSCTGARYTVNKF